MVQNKLKANRVQRGTGGSQNAVRLSQCMIVKNEETNIRQALSWGKDIVCEQIVVDTGSTDRTAELAREMGAKVYTFLWQEDFSAAKNFAIEQAKGNWIAFLDADEWFSDEDTQRLLLLLEQIHPQQDLDIIRTKWANLDSDRSIMSVSCQDRIFRNDPSLRYHYRIHEELFREGYKNLSFWDAQDQLTILHTGYAGAEKRKQKGERNARMLEEELQKNPHDGMCWAYLGDAYKALGNKKKAWDCYRRVLEDPDMEMTHEIAPVHSALELMQLMLNYPAAEVQGKYLHIYKRLKALGADSHPDIDYFLGCMYLKAGDMGTAAAYYETSLKKLEQYHGLDIARVTSNLELVNRIIATDAWLKKDLPRTVSFAVSSLQANKYSADSIQLLLSAFLTEWQEGMTVNPYWQFLCKLYDIQNLKDLLFLHRFSGDIGFARLQERIEEALPAEVREQMAVERSI